MRKSKNRYFTTHIFVSPGDAPGAITLNVIWMEREFDAYKLSRCMCPSNYNRFWDTARYWSKIVNFFIPPLHSTPPLGGGSRQISAIPFGMEKLEWLGYPMVKKIRRYLYSFWRNSRTWRTDGHRVTAIAALCIASHGKYSDSYWLLTIIGHWDTRWRSNDVIYGWIDLLKTWQGEKRWVLVEKLMPFDEILR